MFCGSWVCFKFILTSKNRNGHMQKTKCKKGDNLPKGGGMRGLVGIPLLFSSYNLY